MPKAGQSMEEGTILKWHVSPGARIAKGDVIFEVETDKANMDVEATDSGRLARIVLAEGGTLPVLQPVAFLAEHDAEVDAFLAAPEAVPVPAASTTRPDGPAVAVPARVRAASAPAVSLEGRVKASPAARKIAQERGIDLHGITAGTGPGGRILSSDVPLTATPVTSGRRRLSQMRRAIARNLLLSKQTIPHFYVRLTIDAQPLLAFYQQCKAQYPCSINDIIVLACGRLIREFPAFRSQLDGEEIVELPSVNIGIAVGMDEGLVVPVLMGVERLNLQQIGTETRRLATAARNGKIEGIGQGVFTITNLGMFGTEEFAAIINPPEAAILAVAAAREAVVVKDGALRPGKVLTLTLSADHRIIDGLLAAKFLARLKELLESPEKLPSERG
jgi:pyruvate dehydrogenase E2 component (dihydrolipoamide acetyltransferase)